MTEHTEPTEPAAPPLRVELELPQRMLLSMYTWQVADALRQVLQRSEEGSIDARETTELVQYAAKRAEQLEAIQRAFFPNDPSPWWNTKGNRDMELNVAGSTPEVQADPASVEAEFAYLRQQLAHAGIELHRVELNEGREGYAVAVRGSVRNLDNLAQVVSYAKLLGVVLPSR